MYQDHSVDCRDPLDRALRLGKGRDLPPDHCLPVEAFCNCFDDLWRRSHALGYGLDNLLDPTGHRPDRNFAMQRDAGWLAVLSFRGSTAGASSAQVRFRAIQICPEDQRKRNFLRAKGRRPYRSWKAPFLWWPSQRN